MLFIASNSIKRYLLCILLFLVSNPLNSHSISVSVPGISSTNSNSIQEDEARDKNTSNSKTLKGSVLKKYFLNNEIEFKNKDKKIYRYTFSNNTYFLETDGITIETGKWKISGFQQNYIEINPKDNKKYYLQKQVNNKDLLRFEEITNLNNFIKKIAKEGINQKNNSSEQYEIISSKNKLPNIKLTNDNTSKNSSTQSTGIVIGKDGKLSGKKKNKYNLQLKNCRAYNDQNTNFKYVNIKFAENNLDNDFNTELEFYDNSGQLKKIIKTSKKIPDNFYRVAVATDFTSYYWYKFNNNGRFIIEYYVKPNGGILEMGQLSYQLNGYCEEIIDNEKIIKVDVANIKKTFPQNNQYANKENLQRGVLTTNSNKRQDTFVTGNTTQNYNSRTGNISLRNKCYKNPAEPIVGMLMDKFLNTNQGKSHSADPACANLASNLSLEARQKMLQMGIATTSQYYFYESLIYFSESLELLYRAYDKNTEADKLKSEREYLQRGGLGTDSTKRLDSFVTNNIAVSVNVSDLLNSVVDLNEEGKGYYSKALPKTFEAVWSFTNFAIITAHGLKEMNAKTEQGINNVLNVIGAVATVPKLPQYVKTMYSTTKLISNGARDKKIQDKGNHQKAIASLGF